MSHEALGVEAMGMSGGSAEYIEAVASFASELTRIRHKKNLTIEALANEAQISRTSVTTALGGKELPSARNVMAIASACGVDETPLIARRDQIARMNNVPVNQPKKLENALVRWWWIPVAALAGALVAGGLVFMATQVTRPADVSQSADIDVATGQDPASSDCIEDATVVAEQTTNQLYLLEIIYSARCDAGWARLTRYDDAASGNAITVRIYLEDSPDGADTQAATERDVQGVYTTLLVRPAIETLLCADGSASVSGQQIVTPPLCT